MAKRKLSKAEMEVIANYSNEIKTLKDDMEAYRKLPGMYIGPVNNGGFLNMIREIFQNSVDQMMRQDGVATYVKVTYDENTRCVTVEDNGMGIPFKDMYRIFTQRHTGSNFEKKARQFSSGRHGIGSKVVNALSIVFRVESYSHTGEAKALEFSKGVAITKDIIDVPNDTGFQGTRTMFIPDEEVLLEMDLSYQEVFALLIKIMSITNIGNELRFEAIDKQGRLHKETFVNEDGMLSSLILITGTPLVAPIFISDIIDDKKFDVIFTYDAANLDNGNVVAFSNFCPTSKGTHIDGFVEGVGKFFRSYMNNIFLKDHKKIKVNINDIKTGIRAFISAAHLNPNFTGQHKDELSNDDMVAYARDVTHAGLTEWAKTNPQDLQKIAIHLKDIARHRINSESEKVKISDKYKTSGITGLPSKYEKPTAPNRNDLEFIITEGDSAHGTAKEARCHKRQGLFPIRGKMPNAFSTPPAKYLGNAEVNAIKTIIGAGIGKTFNIDKVKFDKIIVACDADPDGSHIHVMVLSLFAVYMPELIRAGKLYKAVPPLYGVRKGKTTKYFTSRLEYVQYKQKEFSKNNAISTVSGKKLSNDQVTKLLYSNMFYNPDLENLSRSFAIDIDLLEFILMNMHLPHTTMKKILKKEYRFMDVTVKNGITVFEGLANSKSQLIAFNERFINASKNVLDNMSKNESIIYKVNGETKTIYQIMKMFDDVNKGSSVTVFKGLGEMNAVQLGQTTIHPDSERTLIQYTLEDVTKEINLMRSMESDKSGLINSVKLTREDLI